MGYAHIDNLYKNQTILQFPECYAMEKIHGTSANVTYQDGKLTFFSGGEKHSNFVALFDEAALLRLLEKLREWKSFERATVFGEAYGGKCQGMSGTYGPALAFVAFDVCVDEKWLSVPDAEDFVLRLDLEFVHYERIPTNLAVIDRIRDLPSRQAKRNGIEVEKVSEGVVLRTIDPDARDRFGERIVAKHKRSDFSERTSGADAKVVDAAKLQKLTEANAIAAEWVTPMRLSHVLDKLAGDLGKPCGFEEFPKVISAMIEDVLREGKGEIAEGQHVNTAIAKAVGSMYKARLVAEALTQGSD